MGKRNKGVPPWWLYNSLMWTIDKLDNILKKIMPAEMRVLRAVAGHSITQVIAASQELGILNCLNSGEKTLDQLSSELALDLSSLFRLMRGLLYIGIIEKNDEMYNLTNMGFILSKQGKLHSQTLIMSSYWVDAYSRLPESINSGNKSLHSRYGSDFFNYLQKNKEAARLFDSSMEDLTKSYIPAIHAEYDFSKYTHIIDIGGGTGLFVHSILERYPNTRITLFDLPSVVEKVAVPLDGRSQLVGGDFFEAVPAGGDLYIMKLILHDWSDEKAKQILINCRKVVNPGTKLLLFEYTIAEHLEKKYIRIYVDLLMLAMFDGKERTLPEFSKLTAECGFKMLRAINTRSMITLIECEAI